jgi:uncharacterized protein
MTPSDNTVPENLSREASDAEAPAAGPLAAPVAAPDLAPVSGADRISSVDVARGFALLGILLMNIIGFGLPAAAYSNPTVAGGAAGWNLIAWCIQMTALDGKMRALFSMLFGAGVIILTSRGEQRGAGLRTADIYYRRTLWLLLFGVMHAFLLWWGDILYPYALCGLALFPFRTWRPRNLIILASVLFAFLTAGSVAQGFMLRDTRDKAIAAQAAEKKGEKLSDEQKKSKEEWEKAQKNMQPSLEEIRKETDAFRGGYISVFKQRAQMVAPWHGKPYYSPAFFDMYAMMLLGMAFIKLGILSGERTRSFYWKMAAAGLLIGLPMNAISTWQWIAHKFDITAMPIVFSTYQFGRLAVALGYLALLMIIVQAGVVRWITNALAAVGQMAFSNYIGQSVVCGFVFYGYGLGLFGKLERYELYAVVLVVWIFSLLGSPIWLRFFRFGPLEWCWRSLTHWKRQPMRIRRVEPLPASEPEPAT